MNIFAVHDDPNFKINNQGKIISKGDKNIKDLYKEYELDLPKSDASTIGGYVMDLAKKIPLYGEIIYDDHFSFKILSHSRKQILSLEITKIKN